MAKGVENVLNDLSKSTSAAGDNLVTLNDMHYQGVDSLPHFELYVKGKDLIN